MTLDYTYPTPLPSTKGWGTGFPQCQREKLSTVAPYAGGVRDEVAQLVTLITAEMERRGFKFLVPGCWGFGCRATKTSSGGGTSTPSFHSWGLALDVNAPLNPFGADASRVQLTKPENRWVIDLMHRYGWFWLGPPIKDWMHFSFVGSPADAHRLTAQAEDEIGGEDMSAFVDGDRKFREAYQEKGSDPGAAPSTLPAGEREGWNSARFPYKFPPPGAGVDPRTLKAGEQVKLVRP